MVTTAVAATPDAPVWSAPRRFAFRTLFTYLVLYEFDEAFLGLLNPVFRALNAPRGPRAMYRILWDPPARWIGVHVFSVDSALLAPFNSNTDSGIHYARVGCFLLMAVVVAAVWTLIDRRREYLALNAWLSDFLRFALAINLLPYAVNKVIPVQMLPGHLFTTYLIQPLGAKSSAGLLWAFVGYSVPYQMFSGAVELLGCLLLLSRRTLAVGAMLALAASVNVAVLNLCYDVNVKLFALNMVVAALALSWPVFSAIWRLFVLRRAVAPSVIRRGTGVRTKLAMGAFAALFAVQGYQNVVAAYAEFKTQSGLPTATPLYGIYDVEVFRRNGENLPPLTTDDRRWRRVVMETPRDVSVQRMDDSFDHYRAEFNRAATQVKLFGAGQNSVPAGVFVWSVSEGGAVELRGNVGADALELSLKPIDRIAFPLMSGGFRWVQARSTVR